MPLSNTLDSKGNYICLLDPMSPCRPALVRAWLALNTSSVEIARRRVCVHLDILDLTTIPFTFMEHRDKLLLRLMTDNPVYKRLMTEFLDRGMSLLFLVDDLM